MCGPHFSEELLKNLFYSLFLLLLHRVPQTEFEGSLVDLNSSALDEDKEYTKARGAFSFIYDYSIY